MTGFWCHAPLYEYTYEGKVWRFEYSEYGISGPWPIRKDGEPYKRIGDRFYQAFAAFLAESDRAQYRIGGGCERFQA